MQKLTLSAIRPYVRYAKLLSLPGTFSTTSVHAYDARLIYFFSGNARICLNDRKYNAARGSLFLWQSSVCYSIINADANTRMLAVNFDFTSKSSIDFTTPFPTVSDKLYVPEKAIESVFFEDIPQFNLPIHLENMQTAEHLLQSMTNEYTYPRPLSDLILAAQMEQMIFTVARALMHSPGEKPHSLIENVAAYIRDNLSGDLSNQEIGAQFNYHPNYINRVMQKHFGQSLHQYVLSCRVSRALDLLQTTELSITEVAERVGFSSIKHFSQTFKSIYGYSPIHFRE